MEKEFVSYEQAILLKTIGFNVKCIAYYNADPNLDRPYLNMVEPFEHEWCVSAPLKQQVFRWFREKYEVYPTIMTETADDSLYFRFIAEGGPEWLSFSKIYYTYEEAENACIDKLIELAKQL
jgi:hypothetical protein